MIDDGYVPDPLDLSVPTSGLYVLAPAVRKYHVACEGGAVRVPRPGEVVWRERVARPRHATGCDFAEPPILEVLRADGRIEPLVEGEDYTIDDDAIVVIESSPRITPTDTVLLTFKPAAGTWTATIGHDADGKPTAERGATRYPLQTLQEARLPHAITPLAAATVSSDSSEIALDLSRGETGGWTYRFIHREGTYDRNSIEIGARFGGSLEIGRKEGFDGPILEWTADTNLYREGPHRLRTDDRFIARQGIELPANPLFEHDEAGDIQPVDELDDPALDLWEDIGEGAAPRAEKMSSLFENPIYDRLVWERNEDGDLTPKE